MLDCPGVPFLPEIVELAVGAGVDRAGFAVVGVPDGVVDFVVLSQDCAARHSTGAVAPINVTWETVTLMMTFRCAICLPQTKSTRTSVRR